MPQSGPTRKQRFNAALQLAGITLRDWCAERGVTAQHVNYVLNGDRTPGAELNAAIDATIDKWLGRAHAAVR